MGDEQHEDFAAKGRRRRVIWITLAVVVAALVIFHRPILLGTLHWLAVRAAAKEGLKLDFRVEGNVFDAITIRNLHITPLKADAPVESGEADYIRADYNLLALLRGQPADLLESIDVRNADFVINPPKETSPAPRRNDKTSLPEFFPQRAQFAGVTVIVRSEPADLVIRDFNLDLNPAGPGELRIGQLQFPSGQSWSHITGATSYAKRNLILRDLVLNNDARISLLDVDASKIGARRLGCTLDAVLESGTIRLRAELAEEARSLRVQAQVAIQTLPLGALREFGLGDESLAGNLEHLTADFSGLLAAPKTWAGSADALLRDLQVNGLSFDRVSTQIAARDGRATLEPLEVVRAGDVLRGHGSIELPLRAVDLQRSPAHFDLASNDIDLTPITSAMAQPVSGHGRLNAVLDVRNEQLQAKANLAAGPLETNGMRLQALTGQLECTKDLRDKGHDAPWFDGMRTDGTLSATAVESNGMALDSIALAFAQNGENVSLREGTVRRGQNVVALQGSARLLADAKDFTKQPAQVSVSVNAPQLGDFWSTPSPDRVTGALTGWAALAWNGTVADGAFNLYGAGLQTRDLLVQQVSASGSVSRNRVFLDDLRANLNQRDFANASGTLEVTGQRHFDGTVVTDIADLHVLEPLLQASGNKMQVGGAFALQWHGRGSVARLAENGSLKLNWQHGQLGNMKALQANVDAAYSPAGLDIPTLFVGSDRMDFQAIVSTRSDRLDISKIQLDQGQAKYAVGSVSLPFLWRNIGTSAPLFPENGPVAATLDSENLDLKKLFDDLGLPASASGFVSVKLQAGGTLSDLRARVDVDARDLRKPDMPKLEPATFRLSADAAQGKVTVAGELKQPNIQPVAIAASLPFNASEVLRTHTLNENTPLQASVRLPRSSVNFLRQFIPAVEQLDGDVALDAAIGGTIARPVFSGSGDITINVARFTNATLPALHGFQSRLVFRENALTLERFHGDLAGGPFTLGGRITFPKLTEPNIDLDLRAESILIARDDSLTVRTDANLKVTGPLASAVVKGNLALTDSHFLKDIDLLPIGLPGRPAPEPVEDRPDFSVTDPPVRDWKLDIAIKTKDPFSIRGNLANGSAIVDLHLGGTGLHPELKGVVRLENVEATLPFSRLEITNGSLYFDPSDPFNPKIELQGTSVIRDYTVRVYVYGSSLSPQAIFTSEPPLPQEEIISLLATGTTRQELTGNSQVLAGRAATLVIQQLYRKFFKKGQPTESNSMFDRFQLDLGTVDPRTGREQATARFKINQNWVLVGDIGVGGEFRGLVKYLIRFH